MLLVNLKKAPKKELKLWQLKNLLDEYENAANREADLQYKSTVLGYAYKKKYLLDLYIARYISAIYTGRIAVSDENKSATIDLLNMFNPNTFFKFNVRKQNEDENIRNVVEDVLADLLTRNSGDGHNAEKGNSVLEQDGKKETIQNVVVDVQDDSLTRNSGDGHNAEKGNSVLEQKSGLVERRYDRRISKIMSDGEKGYMRLIERNLRRYKKDLERQKRISAKNVECDIDKINEDIKSLEQQISDTLCELEDVFVPSERRRYRKELKGLRKKLHELKDIKNSYEKVQDAKAKVQELQTRIESNREILQTNTNTKKAAEKAQKQKTNIKPMFVRAMPYAASLLLLVGTTVLFANDSAHADNDGKIKKEVKATNAPSVKKDDNTVRATVQDLVRARDSFVAQKIKPIETDVVVKSGSKVAQKTIENNVVKNNENVKSSDKFYDSRLDKFFGNKKSDVLQKIQNRMQNVDLGGISAERVAYTIGVYSAYGYNIDVLNNFVNGAELNSDQIKELKNAIDLAKPHGTGVRDMAAAHMTSREIHEMCAGGGKVNATKKTVRAKSCVKTQISNEKITQQDMLRMHKNIIDSGKYSLTSEQHQKLSWLLLGEHKDYLNPDEAAELTKLLLLAGFDKDIVSQYVGQRIYSEPVLMPDNYVQRVETQNGQKKPVWYSRCFRISRYSR